MNSATNAQSPNKDLKNVMTESLIDDDHKPSHSPSKPKPTHPFVVLQKQETRSSKDILKAIVKSGVDFERIVQDKQMNPKKL